MRKPGIFLQYIKLMIIFIGCIFTGYLLLTAVYCIPTEKIEKNITESAEIFEKEGGFPRLIKKLNQEAASDWTLDNYTDSLMLLMAAHKNTGSPFIESLNNVFLTDNVNHADSLVKLYMGGDATGIENSQYGRYWHGYLVVLKPLLCFLNYKQIRIFQCIVQGSLFLSICFLFWQKNKKLFILPFALFWLFLNPITTVLSMQFAAMTTVTFVSVLILLLMQKIYEEKTFFLLTHFLVFGCLTSYIDLLTAPLLTVGISLISWISLHINTKPAKKQIISTISYLFVWGIGYAGMWTGKWILGNVITGQNIFMSAVNQIFLRTGDTVDDINFSTIDLIFRLTWSSNWIACVLALIFMIFMFCKTKRYRRKYSISIQNMIIYVCIALMPVIWCILLGNHTYIHHWFVYRELGITVYATTMFSAVWYMETKNRNR